MVRSRQMLVAASQCFIPEALGSNRYRVDFRVLRGVEKASADFFEMGVVASREAKKYKPSDWKYSELGENGNPPSKFCPVWAVPAVLLEGVRVSVLLHDLSAAVPSDEDSAAGGDSEGASPEQVGQQKQSTEEGYGQGQGHTVIPSLSANPACTVRLGPTISERAGHFDVSYAEVPTLTQPIAMWVRTRRLLGDVDSLDQTRDPIFMEQVEYLQGVLAKQDQQEETEGGPGEFSGLASSGTLEENKAVRHFLEYGGREGRGAESYVFYFILPAGFELEIF